ncbi:hypothetical protein EDD21DRAFT_143660 [Dissophora ornata]|nr:S-methyl-5-thioribose-1-phosphate isomerase [Dissophora ornata]KAI8606627.1 hypothetical protein EDD21DRAFT_143660 [Dissophora ornata]
MTNSQLYNNARRAGYLFCVLLSVLSATTLLSVTTGQAQQTQDLCTNQVCISATIFSKNPGTIEISLFSKISVGWIGIGMGGSPSDMVGNDLAICWPNATGTGAIISQRAAKVNGVPTVLSTTVPFQVQPVKSGITSSTMDFTCTYSRPLNLSTSPIAATATSVNVVFAIGLQAVKAGAGDDPQKATLQKHTYTGKGALTIVMKQGSSLDGYNASAPQFPGQQTGSSGGGNGTADGTDDSNADIEAENKYDQLVKAHGIMMATAFLLIFPVGAMLVRFYGHVYEIFRWHRPLQVTGFITVISAFGCILAAVYTSPDGAPQINESPHSTFGVILIGALVMQVCIGIFIFHTFDPNRDPNKIHIPTWMHRIWGYCVLIGGMVQVNMGMNLYGMWPTGKEGVWYAYDAWVAIVVLVFVGGSILKKWRDVKNSRSKKEELDGYALQNSQYDLNR